MPSFEELTADVQAAYVAQVRNPLSAPGAYEFDVLYYEAEGRYPSESPLFGTTPQSASMSRRMEAVQRLVEPGATAGERAAAEAAMARMRGDDAGFADTGPHVEDQGFAA